jgi:hypothetical protein
MKQDEVIAPPLPERLAREALVVNRRLIAGQQ